MARYREPAAAAELLSPGGDPAARPVQPARHRQEETGDRGQEEEMTF